MEAEIAVRTDPKGVDNHLLLAGLYSSLGENQKGIIEYTEVLKLDPKNQEAMLYLGALYLQLEDYERANQNLEELLKLDAELRPWPLLSRPRARQEQALSGGRAKLSKSPGAEPEV